MYEETILESHNATRMDFEVDDEIVLEPYPKKYGCSVILLSMFFFQLVNKLTTPSKPQKSQLEFWEWKNTFISWIHAGIVSVWNASSMYLYWEELQQDLVAYHNPVIYSLVAFTSGYFIYDFMDICRHKRPSGHWEVLLHHVAVAGIFIYNVMICRCLAFNTIALMVEYNSFFLHTRKLLQKHPLPYNHWFYRCSVWANIVSFVLFRFMPVFVISYGMYIWHHRVTPLYFYTLGFSVLTMHCINVVLFCRIVKNDVFRYNQQCRAEAAAEVKQNGMANGTATSSSNNSSSNSRQGLMNNNVKECGDEHTSNGFVKVKSS